MKKFFFIIMASLIFNTQSYATTWVQVGDYEYIDQDSIVYYTNDYGQMQFDEKGILDENY